MVRLSVCLSNCRSSLSLVRSSCVHVDFFLPICCCCCRRLPTGATGRGPRAQDRAVTAAAAAHTTFNARCAPLTLGRRPIESAVHAGESGSHLPCKCGAPIRAPLPPLASTTHPRRRCTDGADQRREKERGGERARRGESSPSATSRLLSPEILATSR